MQVECLRCGQLHVLVRRPWRELAQGECPRCGYLGWAASSRLDEDTRRALRERPVELRRVALDRGASRRR